MTKLFYVGLGGFLGSVLRYLVSLAVDSGPDPRLMPWATIIVNVAGCLAIGLLAGWSEGRGVLGDGLALFVMVGLLGGFTTFSAFGLQTAELVRGGYAGRAALNVAAQVVPGLAAVWLGFSAGRMI